MFPDAIIPAIANLAAATTMAVEIPCYTSAGGIFTLRNEVMQLPYSSHRMASILLCFECALSMLRASLKVVQ